MPDIAEWAGMSFFAALLGGFLGYTLSYGSGVSSAIGALALVALATVYIFVVAE